MVCESFDCGGDKPPAARWNMKMFGRNRNRDDKSPETLAGLWTAKFGTRPHPDLLAAIEDWKLDRRGNFRFRMKGGRKLFIGHKATETSRGQLKTVVESEGGWFAWLGEPSLSDVWHMMLAQYSLGRRTISIDFGSKTAKAQMWAAATMMDMKVENYAPDARAIEYLNQLRSSFGR